MINIVIGTKAQLIKMAPVMVELTHRGCEYRYISTGQHQDTMEDILDDFGLPGPDIVLYDRGDVVSSKAVMPWFFTVLYKSLFSKKKIFGRKLSRADHVLVHGDTLSTLIGAIMGRLAGAQVVHVESGLRSFSYFHPFPEEIIRVLTFRLSDIMFCPDERAVDNLKRVDGEIVNTSGNTLYDSWRYFSKSDKEKPVVNERFGLVSLHRYENFQSLQAAERIVSLLEIISDQHKLRFVLHKPTERALKKYGLFRRLMKNDNISCMSRVAYFDFMRLLQDAEFLVSDGGSNQEECFYMGKPLLLLREKTERYEGLGENCMLSCYSEERVRSFSSNVEVYLRDAIPLVHSPSQVIVDRLIRK